MNAFSFIFFSHRNICSRQLCLLVRKLTSPYPETSRSKKEKLFLDSISGDSLEFPSIDDKQSIHLTVVVPAYEEEERCKYITDKKAFHICFYLYNHIIFCFSTSYVRRMYRHSRRASK